MQNKGIIILTAVLLTLVCVFYLSFAGATRYYDAQAAKIEDPIAQQDYKDSVRYLGVYSYQKCLETQIGLGLDLKGGMNVILEVSVPDVVDMLADHKTDVAFTKSLAEAKKEEEKSQSDFISLFVEAYKRNAPGRHLAEVFATQQLQGKVSPQSSDSEVEKVLRSEVQAAIDNSFTVVRTRIDKFGVVQPNIQKLEGQDGRIMVEMPGVREPDRIRKLLEGSANLEFWETYNAEEIVPYLVQLDREVAANGLESAAEAQPTDSLTADKATAKAEETKAAEPDSTKKGGLNFNDNKKEKGTDAASKAEIEKAKKQHPLLAIFQTTGQGYLATVGFASERDTAEVNKIIYSDVAKKIVPSDCKLLWGAKPEAQGKHVFALYAIKVTSTNGRAPIEGDVVTDAKDEFDHMSGSPVVTMQMNSDGARRWAAMTKANIHRAVAVVLDDVVYSAPRVNSEITGGNTEISGNFTVEETKDLANTLKSGRMPAPARIVQSEIVGPSLGAQSIMQGFISFVLAFICLMIYMVAVYGWIPGMMANAALLVNIFFTLGILTSFQAALTMSGIAGMVLSLGTAVDANVLIFERSKEELRAGKGIKQAVSLGYSNAFSAIFDSNITSLITGVILYIFGTGPIRGFATTWIIGIVCSFFTAVYLTRIVFEHQMKKDKWLGLTFTTRLSENWMRNFFFPFMAVYKKTFTIVGIMIAVFIVSFFLRGMSRSIDFTGGRNYVIQFEQPVEPEQVRTVIAEVFPDCTSSAIALGTDHKRIRITTNYKIESNDNAVDGEVETMLFKALKKAGLVTQPSVEVFKNPDIRDGGSIISSSKVGPSVAKDITYGAIMSVILALIAIFFYILVRFNNLAFSVGSIVALTFDTLVVLGVYSLCWGWVPISLEVDQTFIGAVLTVIGYSINDKVVVFDRIRENLRLHPKQPLQEVFNDSICQTLSRTINTGATTLLVLVFIFVFGGDSIRSFSFAMILGVVFGTLSSIFIASPVAYLTLGHSIGEDKANKE